MMYLNYFLFLFSAGFSVETFAQEECPAYYDSTLAVDVNYFVDVEPSFPGGPVEMGRFISANVRYPEEMYEQGPPQSRVYVTFIVLTDGTITSIGIADKAESQYTLFDREAIRVVSLMPAWEPGSCNGKTASVGYILPIQVCLK